MTLKRYTVIKTLAVVILGLLGGQAIVSGNYIIPLLGLAIIALALSYLRERVDEIIENERDIRINGRAAGLAIQTFGFIMAVVMVILYANRGYNPMFVNIASLLAYSVCLLLILVTIFHAYLKKYAKSD